MLLFFILLNFSLVVVEVLHYLVLNISSKLGDQTVHQESQLVFTRFGVLFVIAVVAIITTVSIAVTTVRTFEVDRIQRLADVLRAVPRPQRRQMVQTLEEHDPETPEAVNSRLYVFDDLEATEDRTVQKLLAEVDGSTLAIALSNSNEAIREKIFNNLSRRARVTLQEELEFQSNMSATEIAKAQSDVVSILARLDLEAE